MRNEDNDCIRYLMKEMDPSEELLMERAMMEDEDLLIEVESMRQTLKKLDQLPEVDPPSHIQDSIMEKAAEQAEKNRHKNSSLKPAFKYAIAATLALTISAGGAWLYIGDGERSSSPTSQQTTVSISSSSSVKQANTVNTGSNGASTARFPGGSVNSVSTANSSGATKNIDPWVDRDDILRFEDQFSNQKQQFQTILQQSTEKLRRIQNPTIQNNRVNSIQLTGSGN